MISRIGVTDDNASPWPDPVPPRPAPPTGVEARAGSGRSSPAWIADTGSAPTDRPLALVKAPDGLLRAVELEQERLEDLADVDTTTDDGPEPTVLVRDPTTGIFHTRRVSSLITEPRGSTVWYVDRPPSAVLPEHWRAGDFVAVIAGDERGDVYEIIEE